MFSITHHSVFIIHNSKLWVPRRGSLFGCVFKFCFHHSILWFLSDELAKLKTTFGCFWIMETELWWHFYKYTHISGTHGQREVASLPFFFFLLLTFSLLSSSQTHSTAFFFFFFLLLSFSFFLPSSQTHSNGHFFFFFFILFLSFLLHRNTWITLSKKKKTHEYQFLKPRKSNP